MRRRFFRSLQGIILTAILGTGHAVASQAISIEDLAREPALQSVSMSPDGKHLVGLIPSPNNPEETALAVWDTTALSAGPKVVTPSGDRMKFISASALKADKIFVIGRQEWTGQLGGCGEGKVAGATMTFVAKAYLTGVDQKSFEEAFAGKKRQIGVSKDTQRCLELAGTASLVDTLPLDPDNVIISRLGSFAMMSSYYRYNLKTGNVEHLFDGGTRTSPALLDPRTGELLAQLRLEPLGNGTYEQQVLILNKTTGQFEKQELLTNKLSSRHELSIIGIDDASGKYYVLTDQFSDKAQVWFYDSVKQKFDDTPVVADAHYSILGLIFGRQPSNFNQVVGFVINGPHRQVVYVDPILKGIQTALQSAFDGQQVSISSYTDDFSKVLFSTQSASSPTSFHMLLNKKELVDLGASRPWLKTAPTGEQSWVTYKARDGLEIPAILDLPTGWKKGDQPAPAIVMPHGGPWARDYMGWDASGWVPMLTSRGYAVIRPQYRGSSGLGRALWLAGDNQWGLKMSDDLDDAAAWLVDQGIAARDRLAIFGYSYGGFAAIAATVRDPSPFKCAISGAPVANLGRLNTAWSDSRLQRILQTQTVTGMDPMKNADKAHLPIMVFAGTRDVRTPPAIHARPFYDAVKSKTKAQYHAIPNMPHSMPWYPSQQRETLALIENYLANDCGLTRP